MLQVSLLFSGVLCGGCASSKGNDWHLSEAQAIQIAEDTGRKHDWDISQCERTGANRQWWIEYRAKEWEPGKHFTVLIDDKTGKPVYIGGE